METKQELLTLNGKEYILDIEQAKKLNLLKEKDSRVKSWDEFKEKYSNEVLHYTATQLTGEEATALAAFSKLLKLRRDWVGEWEPDWNNTDENRYCVFNGLSDPDTIGFTVESFVYITKPLSFPTKQMAKEFLNTFRNLVEEAKMLI